jgi:hypothetical protein
VLGYTFVVAKRLKNSVKDFLRTSHSKLYSLPPTSEMLHNNCIFNSRENNVITKPMWSGLYNRPETHGPTLAYMEPTVMLNFSFVITITSLRNSTNVCPIFLKANYALVMQNTPCKRCPTKPVRNFLLLPHTLHVRFI